MKWNSPQRRRRSSYLTEQQRRISAAKLFRCGRTQADVAWQLGVSRQTASRWHAAWVRGGKNALVGVGRVGRKAKLSSEQLRQLAVLLLAGAPAAGYETDLWTLKRIAQVIRRKFRITYHPSHVWKLLGQLGWSCQRPERQARERNEQTIRRWLRYRWPRLKKSRNAAKAC